MKKKIMFLTDNLFQNRDYERFGLGHLSKNFEIEVVNVTKITNPKFLIVKNKKKYNSKNIYYFDQLKSFKNFAIIKKFDYCYDFLGVDYFSWEIRSFLKKNKIKLLKYFSSDETIFYKNKKNLFQKIINNFNKNKKKVSILKKISNRINIIVNKNFMWDYGIFQNSHAFNDNNKKKCKEYIKINTFDFDTYLKNKSKKDLKLKNYYVFIDNSIADHPDYNYHHVTLDINEKKYLHDIKSFFDKFESINKCNIVIAANPKKYYSNSKTFGNRIIKYNLTSILIRNSKGVLIHNSKAINFAVLYKKPLYFLTSNQLNKTWFSEYIFILAIFFKQKVININSFNENDLKKKILKINNFKRYQNLFITCSKKKMFSWNIIKNFLTKED